MSQSGYLDSRRRIFLQSHLLHDLACPFCYKKYLLCGAGPPSTTPAAKAGDGCLVPLCGCDRSCFLQRKGGGSNHCDPVLQSTGLHAEPSPAWHWENSTEGGGGRETLPENQHLPGGSRTFLGGGCCCCFSGSVGTALGYLCASTAWQPASPFLFFPLGKYPQKGNQRLQPTVSFSRSSCRQRRKVFRNDLAFIGTYCLERSII